MVVGLEATVTPAAMVLTQGATALMVLVLLGTQVAPTMAGHRLQSLRIGVLP